MITLIMIMDDTVITLAQVEAGPSLGHLR